ncbi:MAG: type II toxin-antitoxin system PemK/MazF family toxin [Candidatus Omnitrophica bacterium]|nr:type II toxin-antitoxin system PemK/MazF family toxin [Candidatus Omnitrophota bacterium]
MTFPHRGEVYLVRFDPAEGSEIKKTRPALIVQNDIGNRYSATTIVAAITTKSDDKHYPTEVPIPAPEGGLDQDSIVRLDHIRSLDKKRLIRRLGKLKPKSIEAVDRAVRISLGLVEL